MFLINWEIMKLRLILICISFVIAVENVFPSIRYVDTAGNGDGNSWSEACSDLQLMIDQSQPGDEIWIAKGVYKPSRLIKDNKPSSKAFIIKDGVSLYGGFAGNENSPNERINNGLRPYDFSNETVLDGDDDVPDEWIRQIAPGTTYRWEWILEANEVKGTKGNASHILYCESEFIHPTVIDGLTIKGANANVYQAKAAGGGIYALGNVTVQNCRLIENSAYYSPENIYDSNTYGGAVHLNGGSMTGCLVSRSYCHSGYGNAYGGAVYAINGKIENCDFEDCVSLDGGGAVYLEGGELNNCTFLRCYGSSGGALYNDGGRVENITVYDCRGLVGGGVNNDGTLLNALIANCYADAEDFGETMGGRGGGLCQRGGDAVNCAVFNCTAFNGGGVCLEGGRLINSTVINNTVRSRTSAANFFGNAAMVFNSIIDDSTETANFVSVPEFKGFTTDEEPVEAIKKSDLSLMESSGFIDTGEAISPYDQGVDLAGNPRISGSVIDRGAYEWQKETTEVDRVVDMNDAYNSVTISTDYYNASGLRQNFPHMGFNIMVIRFSDGSVITKKIYNNK